MTGAGGASEGGGLWAGPVFPGRGGSRGGLGGGTPRGARARRPHRAPGPSQRGSDRPAGGGASPFPPGPEREGRAGAAPPGPGAAGVGVRELPRTGSKGAQKGPGDSQALPFYGAQGFFLGGGLTGVNQVCSAACIVPEPGVKKEAREPKEISGAGGPQNTLAYTVCCQEICTQLVLEHAGTSRTSYAPVKLWEGAQKKR